MRPGGSIHAFSSARPPPWAPIARPNFLKAPPPSIAENPDFQAPAAGSGQMGVPLFGRLILGYRALYAHSLVYVDLLCP